MKQITESEKSRPLTISVPQYMYDYMKENFIHGQASKIMFDSVAEMMIKDNKLKGKTK